MLPHLEQFLLHIQTNNYSAETLYNYERDLRVFEIFLDSEMRIPFARVSKRTIEHYKAFLVSRDRKTATKAQAKKKLSVGSLNRNLSSLRRYLRFLVQLDYEAPVPPDVITLLKMPKKHARIPEFNVLVKLIESPSVYEKNTLVALRNRAMMETLFASGMRISELLSIDRNQIDHSGRIFIRGKGKKERFVYLTDRALDWIRKYLVTRTDQHPALFIPYNGKNYRGKYARISSNYLQMKIKKYREYLAINIPTSAHSLRHGFATYLAESGANPAAIQILLGHESLDTTTRYVHASDKYAEKTHHDFHPLKKRST